MALAPDALSTPARVRDAQGWSVSSHPDSRLIPKINSISKQLADVTGRRFGFKRFESGAPLFVAGKGEPDLWLPFPKIRALTSVSIVGQALTVRDFTLDNAVAYPDGVFRSPDWDAEGRLVRPMGWPRGSYGCWGDLTGHPRMSSPTGWTVGLVGDFGFILPQWSGTVNAGYNPEGIAADLPADLEQILFDELDLAMSTTVGNLRREKTAGGVEVEFGDSITSLQHRTALLDRLGSYLLPESLWAG